MCFPLHFPFSSDVTLQQQPKRGQGFILWGPPCLHVACRETKRTASFRVAVRLYLLATLQQQPAGSNALFSGVHPASVTPAQRNGKNAISCSCSCLCFMSALSSSSRLRRRRFVLGRPPPSSPFWEHQTACLFMFIWFMYIWFVFMIFCIPSRVPPAAAGKAAGQRPPGSALPT